MNKSRMIARVAVTASFLLALLVYSHIWINADVAWHIEGARRLLAGGNYFTTNFDNNSPFVFIFYWPIVWLNELFNKPAIIFINSYLLLWAYVSWMVTSQLISKLYRNDLTSRRILIYTLLFVLLFLPQESFGQREVILIYLFLPYVFLSLLDSSERINKGLMFIIIFYAALAIQMNVLYLALPLFLDGYRVYRVGRIAGYQICFYVLVICGFLLVSFLYPEYLRHIIPLTLCYESGFNFPLVLLLAQIYILISGVTLVATGYQLRRTTHKVLLRGFIGIITLSLLVYLIEMKLWYYHFYPIAAFTTLLLAILLSEQRRNPHHFGIYLTSAMLFMMMLTSVMILVNAVTDYHNPKNETRQWIDYAKRHFSDKTLFFLVIRLGPAYYLPVYSNAIITSPWSNPWFLPNIIKNKNQRGLCHREQDLSLFYSITARNLLTQPPDFIVVESLHQQILYLGRPFDYVNFLNNDPIIASILKHYSYYDTYLDFIIYRKVLSKEN